MRTTLDIDQDVLVAIKELANVQRVSAGRVVSGLVRAALSGTPVSVTSTDAVPRTIGGFRPFPSRGVPVTNDAINQIRDEEGL